MPDRPLCTVCGPVDEPIAVHVQSEQHRALAAMQRDLGQQVPDWAVPVLGPVESSLRVLDTIKSRSLGGETSWSIAYDYELPIEFVNRVIREWQ